jgi:acyl carrier protein
MSSFQGQAKLENVFRQVFDDAEFDFSMDLTREQLPAWDSLGHIRLVSSIEEEFGVQFSIEEIESLTSVGRVVALLQNHSAA